MILAWPWALLARDSLADASKHEAARVHCHLIDCCFGVRDVVHNWIRFRPLLNQDTSIADTWILLESHSRSATVWRSESTQDLLARANALLRLLRLQINPCFPGSLIIAQFLLS